jgi:hypothetical protein
MPVEHEQRLPLGTPKADVYAFLETHGIERDPPWINCHD